MVREFCRVTEFFGDRVEPYMVRGQVLELEYQRIYLLLFLFLYFFLFLFPFLPYWLSNRHQQSLGVLGWGLRKDVEVSSPRHH